MRQPLVFSWRIVLATIIGFLGSACGTVGGVGGGGIFVPMLTLIVGFDTKSAAAISKCKHIFFKITLFFLFILYYALLYKSNESFKIEKINLSKQQISKLYILFIMVQV